MTLPGVIQPAAPVTSRKAPARRRRRHGHGQGIGPGQGSGLGPGFGGGTGGGAYRPGSGVTLPTVLREVKPAYTADAMRAKVQGSVWLECIVMPDGSVGEVKVTRSLDPIFGLDQEAIKAAKKWRFRPGMRQGEPVPVIITIELTFTLQVGHGPAGQSGRKPDSPQLLRIAPMARILSAIVLLSRLRQRERPAGAISRSRRRRFHRARLRVHERRALARSEDSLPHGRHAAQGCRRRRPQRRADPARHRRHAARGFLGATTAAGCSARASRSTRRSTSSSCPTTSATASRASRATACA